MPRYQIRGLHKFAEEDSFSDGCLPDTATAVHVDVSFKGKTVADVIKEAAAFLDVPDDAIELDACEEKGRVDFARTENENGEALTEAETKAWKCGKAKAWYAVYTGHVEQVTSASAKAVA